MVQVESKDELTTHVEMDKPLKQRSARVMGYEELKRRAQTKFLEDFPDAKITNMRVVENIMRGGLVIVSFRGADGNDDQTYVHITDRETRTYRWASDILN